MIEYMYSRMIATMASIALVAVVVSSSFAAIQQSDKECAERIAEELGRLIENIACMQIQSVEQRIVIDEGGAHQDMVLVLNRTHVLVQNGGFECSKGFGSPVILLSNGEVTATLTAGSGSILKIKGSASIFERFNEITVEVFGRPAIT